MDIRDQLYLIKCQSVDLKMLLGWHKRSGVLTVMVLTSSCQIASKSAKVHRHCINRHAQHIHRLSKQLSITQTSQLAMILLDYWQGTHLSYTHCETTWLTNEFHNTASKIPDLHRVTILGQYHITRIQLGPNNCTPLFLFSTFKLELYYNLY